MAFFRAHSILKTTVDVNGLTIRNVSSRLQYVSETVHSQLHCMICDNAITRSAHNGSCVCVEQ